jgi:hypothetical protein
VFWYWLRRLIDRHFDKLLLCGLIGVSILLSLAVNVAGILPTDPDRAVYWRRILDMLIGALLGLMSGRRAPPKDPSDL